MIRRELGIGRYVPTTPEVERVKEEFGLYRVGLQYKPPPEEVEVIVRACPVMINGEETEKQECAGYKEVRNIVNSNNAPRTRIRGGVLLVIGEGLCLKAPKIQKHTERLEIPGWEFISEKSSLDRWKQRKQESDEWEDEGLFFRRKELQKNDKYMQDVIAGRPVFGEPGEPGGFRLRYGRSRATGLAAAGINPVSMQAHGGFLSVGTQMKTERPGKACAVTPCVDIDGPTVLLRDGSFRRVSTLEEWERFSSEVIRIWDSGEMLSGFGEFLENNKSLVPSGYNRDWWAADLANSLDHPDKVGGFAKILGIDRSELPPGMPFNGAIERGGESALDRSWRHRDWILYLRDLEIGWDVARSLVMEYGTAVPPPWNLWWSDMPMSFAPTIIDAMVESSIDEGGLRLHGGASNWSPDTYIGDIGLPAPSTGTWPKWTMVHNHGILKSALMTLGVEHPTTVKISSSRRNGRVWSRGLGSRSATVPCISQSKPGRISTTELTVSTKRGSFGRGKKERQKDLDHRRSVVRMKAETAERREGLGIDDTDAAGKAAADEIENPGPRQGSLEESQYAH
ncbi:MAG: hypothetical protein Ct9H300mP10_08860 [Methanobacteriota archaeon]|nr:MAG: hypothetical protein Ct9H300mP10_08860 [Euryarchaeota archaeon]